MPEETGLQPEAEAIADAPNPILDAPVEQAPEPVKDEAKPEADAKPVAAPSIRDSLKAAADKITEGEKTGKEEAPKAEAKPEEKPAPVKDHATGKFVADAPSRFSPEAKAEWVKTPETVKAEVRRATSELEAGLKEYQAKFEPLKPYEEIAKQAGTTIPAALQNYLNLEKTLASNPEAGLQKIFDYVGINPRDYAAHVLGQAPDAQASQQDSTIRDLKAEIASLRQAFGQVSSSLEEQSTAALQGELDQFAKANPRFEELRQTMGALMQSGLAQGLDDAYAMADRLNPAPPAQHIEAPKPAPVAQTDRAFKSITGSPGAGSYPAAHGPAPSIKESLRRAMMQAG